jgi:uncharacterized membrane protein YebE (DUF533 family)
MKKTIVIATTVIALVALAGMAYQAAKTYRAKDVCAAKHDVYRCVMVPMPERGYEIRKVLPELLPPLTEDVING